MQPNLAGTSCVSGLRMISYDDRGGSMSAQRMIERLKTVGITFEPGMSDDELQRAEAVFQFRFPKEIREFLSCGVPVGSYFFNYRDLTDENQRRFLDFQEKIESSFRFDLKNNRDDLIDRFCVILNVEPDPDDFDDALIRYLKESVKLIPFYAHRCFFDGMDNMPIVSFWQSVDTVFYGGTFENYLECEFLNGELVSEDIHERMQSADIWKYIVE